jgi:hypothetical protein
MPNDFEMLASLMPSSPAEREAIVARARMELFKLARELDGAMLRGLEKDIYEWIVATGHEWRKMFWREPEKAVRLVLHNQLVEALRERGLDIARLSGN